MARQFYCFSWGQGAPEKLLVAYAGLISTHSSIWLYRYAALVRHAIEQEQLQQSVP
jgi:hypothetical protein